ncbi:hypothetical protein RMCBS344292_05329 [Rhizopus microsporus]|nr:hypothetical protein RMCBS344292_05329 [Rhizopus microsporus]
MYKSIVLVAILALFLQQVLAQANCADPAKVKACVQKVDKAAADCKHPTQCLCHFSRAEDHKEYLLVCYCDCIDVANFIERVESICSL